MCYIMNLDTSYLNTRRILLSMNLMLINMPSFILKNGEKQQNIIRKTKRATLIERKVRKLKRNVLFSQNEAYHRCAFFVVCRPAVFEKFRPGFAGFCGPAPALPCPALFCIFERPSNDVRIPFFSSCRFTLWVAARPLSLTRPRTSLCTPPRSAL